MATMPSIDEWLREAKQDPGFRNCGMYLVHNGTVRETPKAKARGIETDGVAAGEKVGGMHFDYDEQRVQAAVEETRALPGIEYVRVWLNRGELELGDDIMLGAHWRRYSSPRDRCPAVAGGHHQERMRERGREARVGFKATATPPNRMTSPFWLRD